MTENDPDMGCLWMSFCDPEKPQGEQFLGVIITRANDIASAIQKTHDSGLNPGGQVAAYEIGRVDPAHFDKLLTKHDIVLAAWTGTLFSRPARTGSRMPASIVTLRAGRTEAAADH